MTNEGAKEQSGDVLQQLVDALQQSQEDQAGHGSSPHPGRRGSSLRVTCWECKEKGHRRRCPKRRSRPAETFPVGHWVFGIASRTRGCRHHHECILGLDFLQTCILGLV